MKIQPRQIETFLKNPDSCCFAFLIYGPDTGLVKERLKILAGNFTNDLNDPFNVATLTKENLNEDPARLMDEANAISMLGGRRVIIIKEAADWLTPALKDLAENPSDTSIIIIEGQDLQKRSSLRALCESENKIAVIPCYADDEQGTSTLIRTKLHEAGIKSDRDAIAWLASHISGDRQKILQELEKLTLYKSNDRSPLTLTEAQACCGEAGSINLDDLIYAVADGNFQKASYLLDQSLSEGTAVIAILRSLQEHFRKLHIIASSGKSVEQAMKENKIFIFFKKEAAFKEQSRRWKQGRILTVLERINYAEARCKKTGSIPETLCGQLILSLCQAQKNR